jgi:pimeloyl-ACP methyl ester carboxylesterase
MPACDLNLTLPDGRRLAYAEFGDRQGMPVIYFHGTPSSRLEPLIIGGNALAAACLRLVAFDRPGLGGSDFLPGRTIGDIAKDAAQLADHLGFDRFAVLGMSGGGPYAAACAAKLPERLNSAVIVSGTWTWAEFDGAVRAPVKDALVSFVSGSLPHTLLWPLQLLQRLPPGLSGRWLELLRTFLPEPDQAQLKEPWRLNALMAAGKEALRQGLHGAALDMHLIERRYDFDCTTTRMPVRIFHGAHDRNVGLSLVQAYAKTVKRPAHSLPRGGASLNLVCPLRGDCSSTQRRQPLRFWQLDRLQCKKPGCTPDI